MVCFVLISSLALPDHDNFPSESLQITLIPVITFDVGIELCIPEFNSRLGGVGVFAVLMAVPVAAVDKDNRFEFRQHDIGAPWQRLVLRTVHREPITRAVE